MTNITEYRCENCGSSHLKEENDFIVCQACGSKFKDNSKKVETPPPVKVEPPKVNQNTNTNNNIPQNNNDNKDLICCCKGITYISLAFIIYAVTFKAIGAWPGLILGIIIAIIIAYAVHKLTDK